MCVVDEMYVLFHGNVQVIRKYWCVFREIGEVTQIFFYGSGWKIHEPQDRLTIDKPDLEPIF